MKFVANEFETRAELDKAVLALVGDDIPANRTSPHFIEGTEEELKRLLLDGTTTVWGVAVKVTDIPLYRVDEKGVVRKEKK